MKKLTLSLCAIAGVLMASADARPDLVAQVRAGTCTETRASWWGFDPADSTAPLQSALTSGVARLVVDKMPSPWIVTPLTGTSNLELVLEPGVEIQAKPGEFRPKGACLLSFAGCTNIHIVGYGATLRMRHEDYMKPPYEKSEWRHALSIRSCRNVLIEGLTLADSGGDGIYLGCHGAPYRNVDVTIRDVLCDRNHRQGISVISAENLLIENTVMRETFGTPPAAGIDFEPNRPSEVLKNCVMRNCLSIRNQGAGYATWAGQLNAASAPIDLRFENCTARGNRSSFFFATDSRRGRSVRATLALSNCSFEKPESARAVNIRESPYSATFVSIDNCRIVTTNAVGEDVVTPMNETWRKINLPLSSDGEPPIPHVDAPDLSRVQVFDNAPGKSVRLSPLNARNLATYIVYADAARTLHFMGRQMRVGRYEPGTKPIAITDAQGKKVAKIPLPGFDETAFTFNAPAPGFYRMSVDVGRVAFCLAEADAPVAIDATAHAQGFIYSVGSFWLAVPPKTEKFALYASGAGEERVRVTLTDPQGICVWDYHNISGWERVVVSSNPPPGLWKVTMKKPSQGHFEDARFDVAGIPGFLFLTPEKTWTTFPVRPATHACR